jgi:misacylated tRNA(Ala) deacylase
MHTEPYFQKNAYLKVFDANVLAVEGQDVALDATAFYPGGGGQPHDLGRLEAGDACWPVVALRRQDDLVWHTVEGAPPQMGARLQGVLDWERRYALMRTHTALHILCGVVWRDYGAKVTGGNMQPLQGRLDFEFENLQRELVDEIEAKINAEVAAAHPVRVGFLPRAEADLHPDLIRTKINLLPEGITIVRIVEIEGLDVQADGGTHVANTQEVGAIRISDYKSKGRINKRLELTLEA